MSTGTLTLEIVDVRGQGVRDHVYIELDHCTASRRYRTTVLARNGKVEIGGIECDPFARYRVLVWPSDYRPSQFFVTLQAGRDNTRPPIVSPVDAETVTGIQGPAFAALAPKLQEILANTLDLGPELQGQALYESLDAVRKACLLNIAKKAGATVLLDGSTCLDHLGALLKLRGDRFFARTAGALREEAQSARQVFDPAPDTLHHPPDGYTRAGSFKTKDRYGNLQLSFFRRGTSGDDYLVDVDIDEAAGIEHGFEVMRNSLLNHTTSPYDVRDILIRHQMLDPGYDFQFAEQPQVARAARAS